MKLAFSTEYVKTASFADAYGIAYDYGYSAIELFDMAAEGRLHRDSIIRSENVRDARRRLLNRGLEVVSLTHPCADLGDAEAYVKCASAAGIPYVTVKNAEVTDVFVASLASAVSLAEKSGVEILFETAGALADSEAILTLINKFASSAVGAAWNVRETYFGANESVETTIKTLGAYIKYVRLGDSKDGEGVLLGDGSLPIDKCLRALGALNYEGYVCVDGDCGIDDADIVLTEFRAELEKYTREKDEARPLQKNRDGTGTFPWKKYDVLDTTLSGVLDTMAETYPDKYAFKYTTLDYTRTYSEFRRDVDRVAASFIALGVKPGYHVAVWATNVPEWFLAFWAAAKIGAVLVTVNTAYKIHEVEYLLRQSDTHTLIMISGAKETSYGDIISELCPELRENRPGEALYAKALPFLRHVVTVGFRLDGCLTWDAMLGAGENVPYEEVRRRAAAVRPDDVCNMQYTSGTTGFPKGVMLTHSNVINNGKIIGDRMDLSTADRMMIQVPMFHCFGMVLSMMSTMTHGGTLCPLPYFSAKSSLACITQEKITVFNGVPTMFVAMFSHADLAKTDFSHVRTGIMAGANCPPELMRRAAEEMNMKEILSVYGQTESSPGCTMGEVNEDIEHRTETVGSAFPGVECRIIDPETGEALPDGENGEFVARGWNIMKGYYKMPEATEQTIDADGWLHTGDICCRTPDGYYRVTGRLKDMIIRGGENIYPREIEEFYLTYPKVKDVQVIGVPDERYGEEVCAWVILHNGESADEDELREFGRTHMALHKVPRYFVFVKEFPMNAAGKILKYKMKETFEKEYLK